MSTKKEPRVPFSQHMATMSKGQVDDCLTDELAELIKAINETGKSGTLTFTLKLKPVLSGNASGAEVVMVDMHPSYKVETPRHGMISQRMFPTYDGDLLRRDPAQPELDLQSVPINDKPAKRLDDE